MSGDGWLRPSLHLEIVNRPDYPLRSIPLLLLHTTRGITASLPHNDDPRNGSRPLPLIVTDFHMQRPRPPPVQNNFNQRSFRYISQFVLVVTFHHSIHSILTSHRIQENVCVSLLDTKNSNNNKNKDTRIHPEEREREKDRPNNPHLVRNDRNSLFDEMEKKGIEGERRALNGGQSEGRPEREKGGKKARSRPTLVIVISRGDTVAGYPKKRRGHDGRQRRMKARARRAVSGGGHT